jgi:putative alpha-1,2-mannosidase
VPCLPGNDDAGTMSAAYVLASIGIYQAQPGFDAWELSTPMFDSVVVNGASGPRVSISAAGAGPTMEYVASAALGSRPVHTTWLDNEDLTAGQPLTYVLSPVATSWATAASSTPPSISDQHGAGSKKPAGQHRP